ncbi:dipeptide ABC transporter ATP-binding protein [Paraburkholderia hospita]|uniref:ABC transporter ATP-binding protein n=1 Tax=Paraburkholderia hospita TaxID=169430 RepID=A0AAN1JED0_9BURK|nr:ABC transporter ATP-binding protein [Paraburkholderia hospita]AUT72316.1 ABC transporter ATP-binding protein [Paraburkholderia hospita]EIN00637.1 peptide ABC transporter [Paraburkholderia hospita]OUL75815.1 ABC transporter ATP-binding protein [Paraburkholderia hospita]OUL95089.1 ABC transporter ATP-binding protein [Paraburkholderia hospita]SEH95809.1 peptide/nickel transport system ATP-binding protein [Paraburkholderia hospita]
MKNDFSTARTLVDVRGLEIGFADANDGQPLVRGVDLTIRAGECVALVGESGSGKSLTARSLIGLAGHGARIAARQFVIDGRHALQFRERDWRSVRGGFAGLVMQDALVSIDPLRTVGAEIEETLALHTPSGSRKARRARVHETMRDVGMLEPERRAQQYAHELSGGLRQRALIASAIVAGPALVIADEPTTALDVTVQAQILDVLAARLREGVGMLLVSHDLAVVAEVADRVLVMHRGEVVESGATHDVLTNPAHAYTRRLIAAQPSAHSHGQRLTSARLDAGAHSAPQGRADAASLIVRDSLPPRQSAARETLLQVEALGKRYGRRGAGNWNAGGGADTGDFVALDDVSFDVQRGEVVGIVGESGSGKSTCAKLVLGLATPSAGHVRFLGTQWNGEGVREPARRALRSKLQYIPQDPLSSFDPRYCVRQLLEEALSTSGLGTQQVRDRSVELLEQVGLDASHLERRPLSLSGGQRQRVAIARAIAPQPALIVCDEPVSALDVYVQAQVLDLLGTLQAELGLSLLFISHDLDVIRHVSDRVLVFKDGRVVEAGDAQRLFVAPRHAYTRLLMSSAPSLRRAKEEGAAGRVREVEPLAG